jgi:glucose-1-phosphate thymidylyltransferase
VETIQKRQGFYISCIEEIAWRNGWITKQQLFDIGTTLSKTAYGAYILDLVK